ncbi:MAG TPA: bifunctional serine/threonine-protein kinase/formylglycine-generating enzyme family protein [Candidatus Saccharimonadales bacterium]|nr:bifunctional serine/threonine-protein kinase/formylglycine-generating enzyme family protein [Candidatus Saccharimonadales bacterium]
MQPDQRVGGARFTLAKPLGRGGMGEVWLARDERLQEQVALKFLPPEIRGDAASLDDLRRETVRSHKLSHPNIVRIHDLNEDPDGTAFIVMEYIDGPTLGALRLQQPTRVLSWDFLRPLVEQLCAALDYAHSEKVIHRDLKPANIMVDSRGRLRLADFGIAAVASDSMSRVSVKDSTSGTLPYMSPQQLTGERPQLRDDIYALGATLYELLSSKLPFYSGDVTHQILHKLPEPIQDRLAAMDIQNSVPSDVAALVMACLAKDPAQRPENARVVAGWIGMEIATRKAPPAEEPVANPVAVADPKPAPKGKIFFTIAALLLPLVILAGAAMRINRQHPWNEKPAFVNLPSAPMNSPPFDLKMPNLVWIASGSFLMGSSQIDPEMAINEGPQTQVVVSHGFWMGRHEVTQGEYAEVMKTNPSKFKGNDNRPVERVSWEAAREYCLRLSGLERAAGRLPPDYVFRLPTEAEWEYACRAGSSTIYSFGNDATELPRYAWYSANSKETTHPVEQKLPNAWGLYDMHGNVWEWCQDWKGSYPGGTVTDPAGARIGNLRVNRGGCWFDTPTSCRSANRFNFVGSTGLEYVGFRVVLAPKD